MIDSRVKITMDFAEYYGIPGTLPEQKGIFYGNIILARENLMDSGDDFIFVAVEPRGNVIPFNLAHLENVEILKD